jgi:hypothetical protein
MGGGGRRGGWGRGGRREGGRRVARPGGAATRDDRDRRGRRPDYNPRRRPDYSPLRRPDYSPRGRHDYSPRGRSPSLSRRARRPSGDYDDRDVGRGSGGPTRGGRVDCSGDRDLPRGGGVSYGGDCSPPPGGRSSSYVQPCRGHREDYGGDHDLARDGVSYGGDRPIGRRDLGYDDLHAEPGHGHMDLYGRDGDLPCQGRREDYSRDRSLPHNGRREGYYHQERDCDRGANEIYIAPPDYIPPEHPSDLSRPSLCSGRKESDYFGGPSDRGPNRDSQYLGSPGRRYIGKERELLGDNGMTLRISATESGRTTALYQECRSPPLWVALSPPPPLYPSLPPIDTGFLTGGSDGMPGNGFGTVSTHLVHDDSRFKYGDHLRDSYVEKSRGSERHYSGSRDALVKEDDRLHPAADMPIHGDIETDSLYSSRDMLGSNLMPCTQLKQIGDSSTSMLAKNRQYKTHDEPDFEQSNRYVMNGLGIPPHDSSRHGRVRANRLSGRSSGHGSDYGDDALLDITRQEHSKFAPRAEPMEYDGHDYATRDPITDTYVPSEDSRGNVSQNPRHISSSASLTARKDERFNHYLRPSHRMTEDDDNYQGMLHDTEGDIQNSYGAHASVPYPPARGGIDRYSHSPGFEPIGAARRPARQHGFASFEGGRDLSDREVSPMISRKRYRSPASRDHEMDMHQSDDEFAGRGYYDIVEYDPSPRRMSRIYDMVDEDDDDARYDMQSNRNVFSRLGLPQPQYFSSEWTDAEQESHPHPSTLAYGHLKHKPISQRLSRPNGHSHFGEPSMLGRGKGLTKSGKKRMRIGRHHFDGGYTSSRNESSRPKKYLNFSEEDNLNEAEMDHEDTPECKDLSVQKDPPEGSEEFTKQVHQTFLKYTKILNENPAMEKKFHDAPKWTLSCSVCGRFVFLCLH